jgi:hypothetical protein
VPGVRAAGVGGSVFGGRAGEVAFFEAVAVALEREDLGVVTRRSIMAAAVISSPKISTQAEKAWGT